MQFINTPQQALGLDISDMSVKMVEIKKRRGNKYIHTMVSTSLPKGVIEGGMIKDAKKVAMAIRKLMQKTSNKFTTKYANVCLPETKTFIKVIEVLSESKDKSTADLIIEELPRHIPMNLEEMQIDWQKVGENSKTKKFLVGAVNKQIVKDYINVVKMAGLEAVALEIEAQAIVRSVLSDQNKREANTNLFFNFLGKNKDIKKRQKVSKNPRMILDLGETRTSLILVENGIIQFTNSITSISGDLITNMIAEKKKMTFVEAEKAKLVCGSDAKKCKGIVKDLMQEMIDNIAREIINGDEFYKTHFARESLNLEIMLCGGGANMSGLVASLEKKLQRKISIANPLINIERSLAEEHKNLFSYTTVIGLALRNF